MCGGRALTPVPQEPGPGLVPQGQESKLKNQAHLERKGWDLYEVFKEVSPYHWIVTTVKLSAQQ